MTVRNLTSRYILVYTPFGSFVFLISVTEVVQLEEQYDSGPTLTVDSEESAEVNELKQKMTPLRFIRCH